MRPHVYYCPKCDRTLPKERLAEADRELRRRFGIADLSQLRCPVCGCEYIDLDKVPKEGMEHVGRTRKKDGAP